MEVSLGGLFPKNVKEVLSFGLEEGVDLKKSLMLVWMEP